MEFFWINNAPLGRIATATRPRGGEWLDDDIAHLKRTGVALLVSMLTPAENVELDLALEGQAARAAGLAFVNVPIEDRGVPERARPFVDAAIAAADAMKRGAAVVAHCRMGIGRSSMFAASTLVRLGMAPEDAWASIAAARGRPVPDVPTQRAWVDAMRAALCAP